MVELPEEITQEAWLLGTGQLLNGMPRRARDKGGVGAGVWWLWGEET